MDDFSPLFNFPFFQYLMVDFCPYLVVAGVLLPFVFWAVGMVVGAFFKWIRA